MSFLRFLHGRFKVAERYPTAVTVRRTSAKTAALRKWNGLIFSSDEVLSIYSINHTSVEPHEHNYLELAYVVSGDAVHTIGNKSYNISRGQYFFVDYHTVHSYKSLSGSI